MLMKEQCDHLIELLGPEASDLTRLYGGGRTRRDERRSRRKGSERLRAR